MKAARALLVCLCAFINIAYAEGNCPPGMFQTTPVGQAGPIGCAPIPNYNDTPAQPAGPQWATRWGAIATDTATASLGVAEGYRSKRKATKAALTDCKDKGGASCKLDIAYDNECAAMVVGDRVYNTVAATSAVEAQQIGMNKCTVDDTNCRVYYSGCSLPVQVQ